MTLIKIIKSTIKEIEFISSIPGPWQASGSFKGDKLPKWLKPKVIVTSWIQIGTNEIEYGFEFIKPPTKKMLEKVKGEKPLTINISREFIDLRGYEYGPQYKYKHANPRIECYECKEMIRYKDIETAYSINEDGDEFSHDECPKCGAYDSFEYEFETIEQAKKR